MIRREISKNCDGERKPEMETEREKERERHS
jgi:hypothetical protein